MKRVTHSKASTQLTHDEKNKKNLVIPGKHIETPKQKKPTSRKTKSATNNQIYHWQCKCCKEVLQTQRLLKFHMKQHRRDYDQQLYHDDIEKPTYKLDELQDLYVCDVCSAEFQELTEVKTHIQVHVKRINCQDCNESFNNAYDLGIHSAKHDPNRKFHCPLCPYICSSPYPRSFKAHINYVHLKLFPFYCKICTKGFKNAKTFEQHNNSHVGKRPYVCIVCTKAFTYQKYLHCHQVRNHQVGITGDKIENQCHTCNRYFYKPEALKRHITACDKTKKKTNSVKAFLCDLCGHTFTEKAKLSEHLMLHKGDLPFVCTWCSKRFPVKAYLKTHERVHTGEKPYSCEYCGKQFGHHAPFRVHRRMHTGEKPYVCDFCNKGFTTNQGLKLHKRKCPDSQ